jgi:hypothetical protein
MDASPKSQKAHYYVTKQECTQYQERVGEREIHCLYFVFLGIICIVSSSPEGHCGSVRCG